MKNANIELTRKQPNYGKIKAQIKREREEQTRRKMDSSITVVENHSACKEVKFGIVHNNIKAC